MTTHTLTRHRDIQNWVAGRRGLPAIRRVPDSFGTVRARLALNFAARRPAPARGVEHLGNMLHKAHDCTGVCAA